MEKRETEPEKKMNQMGGWGVLYSNFSDGITDGKSRQTFRSVGKSVGTCADGHASDMRALRDVGNPSVIPLVIYVGNTIGDCGTIP